MSALAFHAVPATASPRYYTGRETAAVVGLSHDRFRKVRRDWTRDRDFPAEINEPGEPVRYLADAVDRWVERRSRRIHPAPDARPAPSPRAPVERSPGGRQGRAALRAIRGGAEAAL